MNDTQMQPESMPSKSGKKTGLIVVIVLILIAIGAGAYYYSSQSTAPEDAMMEGDKMEGDAMMEGEPVIN
ncbi:MAG: hypothetical protein COT81_03830 [Candidatus Buchananbacteria bacterium CG10_big_fil_rev_8_21_14_0_10_42_9]|uniref:Uncharacterized protein n=1 Tax=Candidatus Buchananbacteria bacterium CG10_big_fil_rev_8_21_14_0_10_42_9 TaxID=1974526 RepID=A0A2H0W319_9BACT|nr:MAG: hypothetical protein COT81_03830 [Candidatus Buchananbacteria bacterium CG10_big_fil_rev_8_21_14_0_10_42_9]